MIDIYNTITGEKYSFDEDTQRIFKDGYLLSSAQAEPIDANIGDIITLLDEDSLPVFSGLLLKETNSILSLSGKINLITDINAVL